MGARRALTAQDKELAARLTAAVLTISIVGIGLSLTIPLLSIRLEEAGISARANGLHTAVSGIASIVSAPFVPWAVRILGIRNLLFAALVLGAATILGFAATEGYWTWLVIRFAMGLSLTALFVVSEYWINAIAPPAKRGLIMGLYATALALGFATGPAILALTGTAGTLPFLAGAGILLIASVPVAFAGANVPSFEKASKAPVLGFLLAAPAATLAGLIYGAIETGGLGIFPVYAMRAGFGDSGGAWMVSLFNLGNVLLQVPLGLLSDKMDRRRLLMIIAGIGLLGAILMPVAATYGFWAMGAILCLWGGVVGGMYVVGLALLGARFSGAELAAANAAFVMLYSLGMLVGPPALGLGLDLWPPHGLFAALALFFVIYLGVARFSRARS